MVPWNIGAGSRENGMSLPPLGPPVPGWLARQLPPLEAISGRFCRVEPIDSARHGEALYSAYAADREGHLWTYLPWGPYSGPEELCARIDAVRASGVRPEYAVEHVTADPSLHTPDLGGKATTKQVTDAVCEALWQAND